MSTTSAPIGEQPTRRGWTWLHNAKKWHFFVNGYSLCNKFLYLGPDLDLEDGDDDSPDNCAVCRKRLQKLRAKEASR